MEIKRDTYLTRLIARKNNGLIKVITGIRRCGKSFLLFNLFKRHLVESGVPLDHIIEIALDSIENKSLRNPDKCFNYVNASIKDSQTYYLLLDEVQFMPQFEEVLNGFLHINNLDVYVTGSNSKFLSSDIVTEFRGRSDEVRMSPLSFAEFSSTRESDYEETLNDYMTYGGLPQIATFKDERQKTDYLKNIFANVYLKDVVERHRLKNLDAIGTLVDILASNIGTPTNPTKIENTFRSEQKLSYTTTTIAKHIDFLVDSFLISKAHRYDIKGRKFISANLKYYFTDIGLRNARLNFRQQERGHLMENLVYNELMLRGYDVDVGIVNTYGKNLEGTHVHKPLEVDFVANLGSRRFYIQVAYNIDSEEKKELELASLRKISDSFKKILIVNGSDKPWYNDEGILTMGLRYFLLNPESLNF